MKLNPKFLHHKMDDQSLVVPTAEACFSGLVQGNKTVGVIVDCLQHDTTEEDIIDVLCERFDGDRSDIEADVADVISKLKNIGAIDD